MKIALSGYGKMGRTIERLAVDRGHAIIYRIDENIAEYDLSRADVAIDFSIPDAAFENITTCFTQKLPIVSGTTGRLGKYKEAVKM